VAAKAKELARSGDLVPALRLADAALMVEPNSAAALEAKLTALKSLEARSHNLIERAWLTTAIRTTSRALGVEK